MARAGIVALLVVVGMLFAAGCAWQREAPPSEHQQQEQMPSTAQIVCLRHDEGAPPRNDTEALNGDILTRVLTPTVAAQPDGLHYRMNNRMDREVLYATSDMGDSVPKGVSNHTIASPPGKFGIACEPPAKNYDNAKTKMAYFEIIAGDSGYKSTELECKGGMAVATPGGLLPPGKKPKGEKGDLAILARQDWSGRIKEGDVVEVAGYPESKEYSYVRVVRDGRVAAVFEYERVQGGWFTNGAYEACAEF
jgi:hypothetical protein